LPDPRNIKLVEVYEHAGWYLAWNRDMQIVVAGSSQGFCNGLATANDNADMSKARGFWESLRGMECRYYRQLDNTD
jgi:hypothetical protein